MSSSFGSGLLAGVIAGAASTALALLLLRPAPRPADAPPPPPAPVVSTGKMSQLEEENRKLARKVEDLEKARPAAPPESAKTEPAKTETAASPEIGELFGKLSASGLAGFRSPKYGETLDAVKKAGKAGIDYLTEVLKTSRSATERFYAAALLEGVNDAAALPGLTAALKDKDDLVRRMASHAIAVLGDPSAEAALRGAATGDADWGVRVNSAYGLAKLKNDDGLRILREAYESSETPAEYRLAVLGGLADVAAPSTAPLFRKILADTKDVSYLLASIIALEKMKDTESLPALEKLQSSSPSDVVQQAAGKAIDAIRK